jgi:hypothetical protein
MAILSHRTPLVLTMYRSVIVHTRLPDKSAASETVTAPISCLVWPTCHVIRLHLPTCPLLRIMTIGQPRFQTRLRLPKQLSQISNLYCIVQASYSDATSLLFARLGCRRLFAVYELDMGSMYRSTSCQGQQRSASRDMVLLP